MTTERTPTNAPPATRNTEYGFWGTLLNQGHTESDVQGMWDHVVSELAEIHNTAETNIRDFLDSTRGRHLADEFGTTLELPAWAAKEVRFFLKYDRAREFGEGFDGPHLRRPSLRRPRR